MSLELSAGSRIAAPAFRRIIAVLVLASAGTAFGQYDPPPSSQPSTNLDKAIATLDLALRNESGLSDATKQALSQVVGTLRSERAEVVTNDKIEKMVEDYSKGATASAKRKSFESVFNHLKIFGDFRFRYEVDLNRDGAPDRYRQRIRFRLGMDWQLTDTLTLNTKLVTGDPDDPNTEHQTLGTVFNKWDSNWDRLHLTWKPKCVGDVTVLLGKFNSTFCTNPVFGELVWDQDIGAEGAAVTYSMKGGACSKLQSVDFKLMGLDLLESNLTDDVFGLAGQVCANFKWNKCWSSMAAIGYWYWEDPTPHGNKTVLADNAGNATLDLNGDGAADVFESDFGILNPIVSVTWARNEKWPVTFAAEYILNTLARNGRDQGFAAGASVGRNTKAGDWKFDYQYQIVEQDAVFSPVSQDDFLLQTNFRGHLFGAWHNITDDINLHFWALIAAREHLGTTATTDSDDDQWRLRIDLNIKF